MNIPVEELQEGLAREIKRTIRELVPSGCLPDGVSPMVAYLMRTFTAESVELLVELEHRCGVMPHFKWIGDIMVSSGVYEWRLHAVRIKRPNAAAFKMIVIGTLTTH